MMRRATILAAWGLLTLTATAATATAQDATPRRRILLDQLTAPAPAGAPPGTLTRDDVNTLPPPRMDRAADAVRFTVVVGDSACLPGEPGFVDPVRPRAYPRRR